MYKYFEINENGHNIRCKLYCDNPRAIRRVVLFCHGFGGHKDNGAAEKFAQKLLAKVKGAALVTFDLPGHGDDVKKSLRLEDCDTYITLVIQYIRETFCPEKLDAYATSFGGYLVLKYLSEHGNPFHRIALRCPAVNTYDVITKSIMTPEDLARIGKGKPIPVGFDRKVMITQNYLDSLSANDIRTRDFLDYAEDILILHGTGDEVVSFDVVSAFAEEQLIEFIPVEDADHRFRRPTDMDLAIKHILCFFTSGL